MPPWFPALLSTELECRAVVLEELVLISAADWGPIEKASDLVRHGPVELFTFREGCSYRQRLFEWLQREGIPIARSSGIWHLRSHPRLRGGRHGHQVLN